MRTQRETDLEDEVELLRGQLLSSYARVDELEAALPVAHIIGLIAARQRRANSEGET